MPLDKTWTMNCVICGAKIAKLLQEGKEDEARQELLDLTSAFDAEDLNYLMFRLKERSK